MKSEPTLVYRDGFLHDAMRRERVTADELRQAARGQGHDLRQLTAIVLETDGSLSILTDARVLSDESRAGGVGRQQPTGDG